MLLAHLICSPSPAVLQQYPWVVLTLGTPPIEISLILATGRSILCLGDPALLKASHQPILLPMVISIHSLLLICILLAASHFMTHSPAPPLASAFPIGRYMSHSSPIVFFIVPCYSYCIHFLSWAWFRMYDWRQLLIPGVKQSGKVFERSSMSGFGGTNNLWAYCENPILSGRCPRRVFNPSAQLWRRITASMLEVGWRPYLFHVLLVSWTSPACLYCCCSRYNIPRGFFGIVATDLNGALRVPWGEWL